MPEPKTGDGAPEPSFRRVLTRLARHALHISFFGLLEAGVTLLLRTLRVEHLLWARVVQTVAVVSFVVSFTVIVGAELISDCFDAVAMVRQRIRRH